MILEFKDVVKDSYFSLLDSTGETPTAEMVAEDIIDNYEGYSDIDISSPMKHYNWVMEVSLELGRQDLKY